jgi:hypothetical protein
MPARRMDLRECARVRAWQELRTVTPNVVDWGPEGSGVGFAVGLGHLLRREVSSSESTAPNPYCQSFFSKRLGGTRNQRHSPPPTPLRIHRQHEHSVGHSAAAPPTFLSPTHRTPLPLSHCVAGWQRRVGTGEHGGRGQRHRVVRHRSAAGLWPNL